MWPQDILQFLQASRRVCICTVHLSAHKWPFATSHHKRPLIGDLITDRQTPLRRPQLLCVGQTEHVAPFSTGARITAQCSREVSMSRDSLFHRVKSCHEGKSKAECHISICFQLTKINAKSLGEHNHFTFHPIRKMDRKLHVTSVNKSSRDHSIMLVFLQKVKEPSESVREESCQKQKGYMYGFRSTLCNRLILYCGRQRIIFR